MKRRTPNIRRNKPDRRYYKKRSDEERRKIQNSIEAFAENFSVRDLARLLRALNDLLGTVERNKKK
jgi:hypothetical protein